MKTKIKDGAGFFMGPAFVVLLAGCATLAPAPSERAVFQVVETINSAEISTLVELSDVPFIYDAEILMRRVDVEALWRGLRLSGFSLDAADLSGVQGVTVDSYQVFSPSEEMRIFFEKHVPATAYIATVQSSRGTFVLLLGAGSRGSSRVLGFGGPV